MDSSANRKWRIAAIILTIVAIGQGFELYRIKSALKNVFHYDVKVTVKEKNTGETLEGVTIHSPSSSSQDIFRQSTKHGGGMESWQISGIAYEPREFGFSTDGYKRENVVITQDTKWSITVELEPKNKPTEEDGTDQPASAPELTPDGNSKPQPESKVRSQ